MRSFPILGAALAFSLALLKPPAQPPTITSFIGYVGRLLVFYIGIWLAIGVLTILGATVYALASAVPERPDPASVHGCSVTLPNTPGDREVALVVRTTHPLSDCDESAPVAFGASIRDNAGGRR